MKCVTALCWERHRHETLYSVSTICSSNGSYSVGWWHELHQVMPRVCASVHRGSPLCDKAQWLCCYQGWRWCPAELRDYGLESATLPVRVGGTAHPAPARPGRTCTLLNHGLEKKRINSCPLTVCYNVLNLNLYNQHDVGFFVCFCLRQFWISHSLVNSNRFNTFTNTKN